MPQDTIHAQFNNAVKIEKNESVILIPTNKQDKGEFLTLSHDTWSFIILPIFIPIITFILGLALSRVITKIKLLNDLKQKQEYLSVWINLIGPIVQRQATAFKEYAALISSMKPIRSALNIFNFHIDKLKVIDTFSLVALFVVNKKQMQNVSNEMLFKFLDKIEFLERKQKGLIGIMEKMSKASSEFFEKQNESMEKLNSTLKQIFQGDYKNSNYEFSVSLNQVYKEWNLIDPKEGEVYSTKLYAPIIEKCKSHLSENPEDSLAVDLLRITQVLDFNFQNKVSQNENFSKLFEEGANLLKKNMADLLQIKNELGNMEFKFFLFLK